MIQALLSKLLSHNAWFKKARSGHQRLLDNAQHTLSGEFNEGLCAGSAEVLTQVGPSVVAFRWCPPDGTTTEQTIKIVVNFLKEHPERLNEKFINLSKEALREAWSCR